MSAYARLLTTEIDGEVVVAKRAIHPDHRSLLHRELLRLQAAEHPNVVRVMAHTTARGGGFATAWAGGCTLATARLEPAAAAAMLAKVAETVADLHDRGVVHGRLAPSHVILDPSGRPVLCGFGTEPGHRLIPGSHDWRCASAADVEAMGRLILRLAGDQTELEPFPLHRFAREQRWDGMTRRALQTLADQACDPDVERRPSARSLAVSLQSLAGTDHGAPPIRGTGSRVGLRLGAAIGMATALGAMSSQRAWSQGIEPLTSSHGSDPTTAAAALVQLGAAIAVLAVVVSATAEAAGRILGNPALRDLAARITPTRLRSVSGRLAGLALGASVSLACQIRAPHPASPAHRTDLDHAGPASLEGPPSEQIHGQPTPIPAGASASGLRASVGHPRAEVTTHPPRGAAAGRGTEIADPTLHDAGPATWTVGPGDHLWAIAESTITSVTGRPADDAEVTRYWQRLIVENPGVTDPDLVVPGQVIALPGL